MAHTPTPWIGLAALLAMFVIPFLPGWLFEGPRRIRHWPRRHICGGCHALWTAGHDCTSTIGEGQAVHVELRRLGSTTDLEDLRTARARDWIIPTGGDSV